MSGGEKGSSAVDENDIWVCKKCGWTYPNPHPSAKHRRSHRKQCKGAAEKKPEPVHKPDAGSSDNVSSDDEQHPVQAAVVVEQSPTEKQPAVTEESKKTEPPKTGVQLTDESASTDPQKAQEEVAAKSVLLKPEEEPAAGSDAPKAEDGVTPDAGTEAVPVTSSGPPPAQNLEEKASHQATESSGISSIQELKGKLDSDINSNVQVLEISDERGTIPLQVEEGLGGGDVPGNEGNDSIQEAKKNPVDDHSKAAPLPTHELVVPDSDVQGDSEKKDLQESVPNSSQQVKELSPLPTGEEETLTKTESGNSPDETQKEPDTGLAREVQVPVKVPEESVKKPQGRRDSWEKLLDADAQEVTSKTGNDEPSTLPAQPDDATVHEKLSNGNPFAAETTQAKADSQVSAPENVPSTQRESATASSSTVEEKDKEPDIKPHVALKSLFEDDPKAQEEGVSANNTAAAAKRNNNVLTKVLDTIRSSPAKVKDSNEAAKEEEDRPKSRWSSFICCG